MVLSCLLYGCTAGILVYPVPVQALSQDEDRRFQVHLDEKCLILIETAKRFFETAYAFY